MVEELWQRFDEQGAPLQDKSTTKPEATSKGLLHGVAHVWMWRRGKNGPEILVQQRGSDKRTWPDKLDVSAAGHIRFQEPPIVTACRETSEELGVHVLPERLELFSVYRWNVRVDGTELLENELQWLYLLELSENKFRLPAGEVGAVVWKPLDQCRAEWTDPEQSQLYVPHGATYWALLLEALELATQE